MGTSISPCSMWYILVTVELRGPCYGKQDIYNYEPSEVRVSTVGARDAIFYIIWSGMPAWWVESVLWGGDILTAVLGLQHTLHSLKIAHMGQNSQQAVNHGRCTAAAMPNKTCDWGWHGYPAETHLSKEGIKNEKRHMLLFSRQPLTWWVNWIKGRMRQRY